MTPSTPWNWPNCSSPTCSRNTARHPTSPPTGALSSYLTSSDPSVNYSGWNSTSHQDTTRKGTDRWNTSTRSWSNISGPIRTINKMTGLPYSPWHNSPTTMPQMKRPEFLHSSPTKVTTQASRQSQMNKYPPQKHNASYQTWTTYTQS